MSGILGGRWWHSDIQECPPSPHPTQTVTTIDSTPHTISNAYDSADRVTSITYPNGSIVAYGYDDGGSLSTVTQDGALRATYTYYNEVGKPTQVNYGNGKITTYTYYPHTFRINTIVTSGLKNLAYVYDLGGNVTSITDGINSSRSQIFTYDHLNRLIAGTSTVAVHFCRTDSSNLLCSTLL
jgi:YD repeat-containing protein